MAASRGDDLDALIGEAQVVRDRFDALGLLIASYRGPELRIIVANAAYRGFAGTPEVVGRPLLELLPGFAGQRLIAMAHGVLATGEPVIAREWRIQTGSSEAGICENIFSTS